MSGGLTEVWVHYYPKFWAADEEGGDRTPYFRRDRENPRHMEVEPRIWEEVEVNCERSRDNSCGKVPGWISISSLE